MNILTRLESKIRRIKADRIAQSMKRDLRVSDFTIISQNCIGGVFYHDMGLPFQSPTINLFFKAPDFIRFVNSLDYYLTCELTMTMGAEYPIGYLDDVAIYFMHYNTCQEAANAWSNRCKRINRNRLLILCTDMEDFDDAVYEQWLKITYPKILFTAVNRKDRDSIFFPEFEEQGKVPDLIPDRLFYRNHRLIDTINKWAVSGGEH